MTFIDREREMTFLNEKWESPDSQFIVLWGKRRVGKTELVKQFIRNKPHVYFLSESTNETEQLKRFSIALSEFFDEPLLKTRGFASWLESFDYIREKRKKFILVIDEFPYLIQSNAGILSLFQKAWDEYWKDSEIFFLILGSSISMMENEVLGYRSPLYGRRTGQWRIEAMDFESISEFRKQEDFGDRFLHYATVGGTPAYWLQFSSENNYKENLKGKLLKKGEMLYDEVEFLLREELREPRYYFALLQAIACGKRKLSEIVNSTGISQPVANKYLGVLSDLKIVERELPATEAKPLKSKRGLYRITDEFFQFWFRFIFPKRAELEMGRINEVSKRVMNEITLYLPSVYEKLAIEIVKRIEKPIPFTVVGSWWEKNEEIDIVAFNNELNTILFGEVKWSEKRVGTEIYNSLKIKSKGVLWGTKNRVEKFCIFSKSGFTEAMEKRAKKENVLLFRENRPL